MFLFFFLACSKNREQRSIFKDTYKDILSEKIFKFKHFRPPNLEEFKEGIVNPIKLPDTLSPLIVYVQKKHLEVEFNVKLPEEFKFVYDTTNTIVDYLPRNIGKLSTKEYKFIEFDNFDEVFKNDKISKQNFGGALQFSKTLLNKEQNKALLFVHDMNVTGLHSFRNLFLLKMENGKWKMENMIGVSFE